MIFVYCRQIKTIDTIGMLRASYYFTRLRTLIYGAALILIRLKPHGDAKDVDDDGWWGWGWGWPGWGWGWLW